MSFAAKVSGSRGVPIHFLQGRDEAGVPCHWFVMFPADQYDALEQKFGKEILAIDKLGHIVASGYGHTPSPANLARLEKEFGYKYTAA